MIDQQCDLSIPNVNTQDTVVTVTKTQDLALMQNFTTFITNKGKRFVETIKLL